MKKTSLLLVGLLPFLVGALLNYLLTVLFVDISPPFGVISLVFLALWAAFGYWLYPVTGSEIQAALLAHLPAFLTLLLVLFQELVLGRYWMNFVGLATQMFYLPLIYLGMRITFFLSSMSAVYIAAFILMFGAFYLGCWLRKNR